MKNELSGKPDLKNTQDRFCAAHIGLPDQDEYLHHRKRLGNHCSHRCHWHWPLHRYPYLAEPAWWPVVGGLHDG